MRRVYKTLYLQLNRDVLEGFLDAPKPPQCVFVDGKRWIEVDVVGCRTNCLRNYPYDIPVAHITDDIQPASRSARFDFAFIDAGEPHDDPLEATLYWGKAWYSIERAMAIGRSGT